MYKRQHESPPLDAERFRHRDDERISLRRAYHREPDAGVAAGCLDDRLSRLQRSLFLGIFDDSEREAIFYGAKRIEGFNLDVEVHVRRRQPVDLYDGRVSN